MEDVNRRRTHRNPLTRALSDERPRMEGPSSQTTGEKEKETSRKRNMLHALWYVRGWKQERENEWKEEEEFHGKEEREDDSPNDDIPWLGIPPTPPHETP